VTVDGLVVACVGGEAALEAMLRFGQRLVEVRLHHGEHHLPRPDVRVGGVQEVGDLVRTPLWTVSSRLSDRGLHRRGPAGLS
jgi:hypothetical protein